MSNKSLSVIVPVYNVERYLKSCLDSLLKTDGIEQTQIILIDDGSSDKSPDIADDYASRYEFIEVIHKSNEGPSAARNAGIRKADGEYIFFCDSDDEVIPEAFSEFIKLTKTSDADIVLWDGEPFDDNGSIPDARSKASLIHRGLNTDSGPVTGKKAFEMQLDHCNYYPAVVWLGLHRRKFLVDNELFFEEGLLHEDELWAHKAMLLCQTLIYIPKIVYRYRSHPGSITHPGDEGFARNIEALLYVYPELFRLCETHLAGDSLMKKLDASLSRRYVNVINEYAFYRYGYGDKIDMKLLWRTSGRFKDRCKVLRLMLYGFFWKVFRRRENAD